MQDKFLVHDKMMTLPRTSRTDQPQEESCLSLYSYSNILWMENNVIFIMICNSVSVLTASSNFGRYTNLSRTIFDITGILPTGAHFLFCVWDFNPAKVIENGMLGCWVTIVSYASLLLPVGFPFPVLHFWFSQLSHLKFTPVRSHLRNIVSDYSLL